MNGKTVVITGASSGIGAVAARKLSELGARVIVVGRSPEATKNVAQSIGAEYYIADFAKFSEVLALAAKLLDLCPKIDVLMNNAGGIIDKRIVTVDGHESTFQINHLAPFLLTQLLLPCVSDSGGRIINTSSGANRRGRVDLNDLENARAYSGWRAYAAAKLMNILHAEELARRLGPGVTSASFHPGVVATGFAREGGVLTRFAYNSFIKNIFMRTPEQGAETMLWLATSTPGRDWQSGKYYDGVGHLGKKNCQTRDPRLAPALWNASAKLCDRFLA